MDFQTLQFDKTLPWSVRMEIKKLNIALKGKRADVADIYEIEQLVKRYCQPIDNQTNN